MYFEIGLIKKKQVFEGKNEAHRNKKGTKSIRPFLLKVSFNETLHVFVLASDYFFDDTGIMQVFEFMNSGSKAFRGVIA